MKKLFLTVAAVFALGIVNAQEQTAKGKLLLEVNTGFGENGVGGTGLQFNSYDGGSEYNIGAEGGYFVMDDLAIKVGLGYGGTIPKQGEGSSIIGYKIGAKYYIKSMIPFEISYNGGTTSVSNSNSPSYLGLQAGYAIFLGDMVSLEPGIRFNNTLDDTVGKSFIQFNIGFVMHF